VKEDTEMAKYTLQMNDKLESLLDQLAENEGISKAQVVRRALTLLALAEEQEREGYSLALTKDGEVAREILIS
jgi:predicted transcriptional regulator